MALETLTAMWDILGRLLDPLLHLMKIIKRRVIVELFFLFGMNKVKDVNIDAEGVVFGLTGKRLLDHRIFRNVGNSHAFIAAAAYDHGNPHCFWVYLLEQFGSAFRIAWQSGESYGWLARGRDFGIHDVDRDGVHEISFASGQFGSGGGSTTLYLFVTAVRRLFQLEVAYDWQDHSSGPTPKICLRPEDDEPQTRFYHKALEGIATKSGFLEGVESPDLNSPLYADLRWHRDHGSILKGSIVVRPHCYEGPPKSRGSITACLDEGDVVWTAYFKGPVIAHFVKDNKHAVIYCPDYIYHWPSCFCRMGNLLLIGTRGDGIVVYNLRESLLTRFTRHGSDEFPEVSAIVVSHGDVLINDSLRVPSTFFVRFSGSG